MRISTRQPQKIFQLDGWQETLKYDTVFQHEILLYYPGIALKRLSVFYYYFS